MIRTSTTLAILAAIATSWSQPIRPLADSAGLRFGTPVITSRWNSASQAKKHLDTIATHFNITVPEHAMRPKQIQPKRGVFDWGKADSILAWAEAKGMEHRGHFLVWDAPSQNPDWLTARAWSTSLPAPWTRQELLAILKAHIDSVVGRYRGRILEWDVVNEATTPSQPDGLKRTWWYNIIGPDYIDSAFVWAHKADPGAYLYLNEYDADKDYSATAEKADTLFAVVSRMVQRGLPIHGVGLQGHMGNWISEASLRGNIARYKALDLRVSLTEVDMMKASSAPWVWGAAARACLDNDYCTSFVTWGVDDSVSWFGADCDCLLWDSLQRPKRTIQDTLRAALRNADSAISARRKAFASKPAWLFRNTPPTASLKVSSTAINQGTTLVLTATIQDAEGAMDRVELLQGGKVVRTLHGAPWTFSMVGLPVGTHIFQVVAHDRSLAADTSSQVQVRVAATTGLDPAEPRLRSPAGRIVLNLERAGSVSLRITSPAGALVRSHSFCVLAQGRHELAIPVEDLPTQPWIVQPFLDGQPIEAPRNLRLR